MLDLIVALIINSSEVDEHEEWLGADTYVSCEAVLSED